MGPVRNPGTVHNLGIIQFSRRRQKKEKKGRERERCGTVSEIVINLEACWRLANRRCPCKTCVTFMQSRFARHVSAETTKPDLDQASGGLRQVRGMMSLRGESQPQFFAEISDGGYGKPSLGTLTN